MEIGYDTLCFLDLKITVLDGQLFTTVYSKPTDSHIYLHSTSCHKRSSIIGIQKGVALRLKRICSTEEEYKLKSKEYSAYLMSRGHNAKSVSNIFDSLSNTSRNEARQKKVKNNDRNMVFFATTFNPVGPNVSNIVNKHKHLLFENAKSAEIFTKSKIIIANKRGSNLKELLLRGDPYNMKSDITTIMEINYWTNGKICAKVVFPRYTESVKFRSQSRERASKRKPYRGLGTR